MKDVAIVIPLYKSNLDSYEEISLRQAEKKFFKYDIFFLMPQSLSIEFEHKGINEVKMADDYFTSVSAYNGLMLTQDTYENFTNYRYILIYQLDGFVFEDQLTYFCNLNYEYIGAPWLYGVFEYLSKGRCVWYVGNGGVSLRKVQATINLLQKNKISYKGNEDIFFARSDSVDFRVAPLDIALKFSFDEEVRRAFKQNNYCIPMCAHAWYKYDLDFYRPYIEAEGYDLSNLNTSIQGNLDKLNIGAREKDRIISQFFLNKYSDSELIKYLSRYLENYCGKIVIWGNGRNGVMLNNMLKDAGQLVLCVIDTNTEKNYEWFKVAYTDKSVPIIVSPYHAYSEISKLLQSDGYYNFVGFKQLIDGMIHIF